MQLPSDSQVEIGGDMFGIIETLFPVVAVLTVAHLFIGGEKSARLLIVLVLVVCAIAAVADFLSYTPTKLIP